MTTAERIYQQSRDLPEAQAQRVLDFIEFLQEKLRRKKRIARAINTAYKAASMNNNYS